MGEVGFVGKLEHVGFMNKLMGRFMFLTLLIALCTVLHGFSGFMWSFLTTRLALFGIFRKLGYNKDPTI